MQNARLDEAQAAIKIARRGINNLRYADNTTLIAENEEELKSLLMKVKEESGKAGLKLNFQKTKIMAFSPITSWQIHGETMETVTDFIFRTISNYSLFNISFQYSVNKMPHLLKSVVHGLIRYTKHFGHIRNLIYIFVTQDIALVFYDLLAIVKL